MSALGASTKRNDAENDNDQHELQDDKELDVHVGGLRQSTETPEREDDLQKQAEHVRRDDLRGMMMYAYSVNAQF